MPTIPDFLGLSQKLGYCPSVLENVRKSWKCNTVVLVLYVARICIILTKIFSVYDVWESDMHDRSNADVR